MKPDALLAIHPRMGAAVIAALIAGGCSLSGTAQKVGETCRPAPSNPDVTVCQDGGRITVFTTNGASQEVDAAVREAVDTAALPTARTQPRVVSSNVSECRAVPVDTESDGVAELRHTALSCRLDLTIGFTAHRATDTSAP